MEGDLWGHSDVGFLKNFRRIFMHRLKISEYGGENTFSLIFFNYK